MFGLLSTTHPKRVLRIRPDEGTGRSGAKVAPLGLTGFATGTRLATENGWRPVEAIAVGDPVVTYENGPQTVVAMTRSTHLAAAGDKPAPVAPIHVPIGALGNEEPIVLLPEQIVVLEKDAAEALTGTSFAVVPAKELEGFRGIDRIRALRPVHTVSVHFERDEAVFVEGGALVMTGAAHDGPAPAGPRPRRAA